MAKDSTITVPHTLGVEAARERLNARVDWALKSCREKGFEVEVGEWEGALLPFTARGMGQTFAGRLELTDEAVTLHLALPFLLRMLLPVLEPIAQSYGAKLLAA